MSFDSGRFFLAATRALARGALVLLVGCTLEQNAALEVQMRLPSSAERPLALVQVAPESFEWEDGWERETLEFDTNAEGCNATFSVVTDVPASQPELTGNLRMKIWFCPREEPRCLSGAVTPPEWHITLSHPFYEGERTYYQAAPPLADQTGTMRCQAWDLPSSILPSTQDMRFDLVVDSCSLLGCADARSAPDPEFAFCRSDGVHECDSP